MIEIIRDIKIDILSGKYKCIDSYEIPKNPENWSQCPNCGLRPLVWEFDNGRTTACGCGKNKYDHFSIWSESIMSHIKRNGGSVQDYNSDKLMINWNYWVHNGIELEPREQLLKEGKW
jgi:hypothetical protein